MFEHCAWLNEPRDWNLQGGVLNVATDANTDFWRETHYGFTRDSGHFFQFATAGDFTAELRVAARYSELYDQAGLGGDPNPDAVPGSCGSKRIDCQSITALKFR